jgi:cytochrome c oxidase assembly protein subunit 15
MLGGLLALQALTGIGNVVLQWPLAGALLHSVGAAALVATLVGLLARREPHSVTAPQAAVQPAWRAPQQVVLP